MTQQGWNILAGFLACVAGLIAATDHTDAERQVPGNHDHAASGEERIQADHSLPVILGEGGSAGSLMVPDSNASSTPPRAAEMPYLAWAVHTRGAAPADAAGPKGAEIRPSITTGMAPAATPWGTIVWKDRSARW
ncbi:MAG: hypothetical protein QM820_17590 [Minicystis sp.]